MTANRRSRSGSNDRELRLWKVGRVLALAFIAALVVAGSVFYSLVILLDFQQIDTTAKLDAKTLFELVKLSFGVVAGAGALVALVVAYRRQRVDEAGAHREATRLHTERFTTAVSQLGDDSPAVRLGGVHALAGLADDAPDDNLRQTCIDVLCAYLQLPFTPDPGNDPTDQEARHRYLALRRVRHTILRLIGDHYRRPRGTHRSWQGCDLDLSGVTIDGNMDFRRAVFSVGTVDFTGAVFSDGMVDFTDAVFSGDAPYSGGRVHFGEAVFCGSRVIFRSASFRGGRVDFGDSVFSGGVVSFGGADFCGGRVNFIGAVFSGGTVYFEHALFRGSMEYTGGTVFFDDAQFSGSTVNFCDAVFVSDTAFTSTANFRNAVFLGGTVDFRDARGPAPGTLLAAVGTSAPERVVLSSAWLPPTP
ncbi:pentapeptide repeat-containing protein [Streptomyces sp. NPDC058595]|uniref:pentapeptide repeat-containing protein n=1 Tax=Streptomyces sp. NPDC058595 TaxID=3346550 RepID=UPI003652A00C